MGRFVLEGKVVLLTGGARGIGYETTRLTHAKGAAVALVDLDADATERGARRLGDGAIGLGASKRGVLPFRTPLRPAIGAGSFGPAVGPISAPSTASRQWEGPSSSGSRGTERLGRADEWNFTQECRDSPSRVTSLTVTRPEGRSGRPSRRSGES
jgi:hypothetical protein